MSNPATVVLPDLRPMVNWNLGQNYQINGYLQFQMECLGESREYDYWFFAGVGGDNHTQVFTADTSKWCHSLSQIDFSPEFARTLYDAVGYDFTYVTEQEFNADRPRYIGELIRCIDRGIPVIAKETSSSTRTAVRPEDLNVGIPADPGEEPVKAQEFSVLVGYEESGGQLLFVEGDSTKPYTVPTNQNVSYLFVIPGAKKQAPPLADVYRQAVLNIPALLTRRRKGDVSFGREAFDAWAKHLLAEDYAGWTDEQLNLWRLHTTYVCIVATNGSDRHFLDRAARLCPDLPFLPEVFKAYGEMGRLWIEEMDATGGSFNISKQTLRDPQARRRISDFIRRYTDCCDRILEIYRANGYTSVQTARLVVRLFTRDDWKELQQLAVDKRNTGGDRYDHAWPTEDKGAGEMAQWCVGQRCFAVCLKESGKLIGFVRFNSVDDKGQLDLGHMFHSRYRGEGYASEAIRPLLAVAFADPKVKGIVARNAVEWPGQLTPLIELGFRELQRIQAPNFNGAEGGPNGFVACRMGLSRAEWQRGEDKRETMNTKDAYVNGFKITIVSKPGFEAVGYTRPVSLDGSSIGLFIKELTENGRMNKLAATLHTPQQMWVCLSDEGYLGFGCRCTVCVEKTEKHDLSQFKEGELFSLHVPASEWADLEVNEEQDPTDLHRLGVYNMLGEIGYDFNSRVGLHFDNEHEWEPGKKTHLLLPVICSESKPPAA